MTTLPKDIAANPSLARWISLDGEGRITVRTGKVELGQGILTALAVLAAHELGVEPSQLRVARADTIAAPDEGYTAGSYSIQEGGSALRWACALTRQLFAEAARRRLGHDGNKPLLVKAGVFSGEDGGAGVSYWELSGAVDIDVQIPDFPPPSLRADPPAFGEVRRFDLEEKLGGRGAFIQDMELPDMAYGAVLRGDHPGDRLVSFDRGRIASLDGVICAVQDGHFGGVVAVGLSQLRRAMDVAHRTALWERSRELPEYAEPNGWMETWPREPVVVREEGSEPGPTEATRRLASRYSRPYIAHASVGPSCGIARWIEGRVEIWTHSQGVYPLRRQVARALRMPEDDVAVRHVDGAGCYGHNGADDAAFDAVLLARAADRPVMCLWTRREELCWSPFGAPMIVEMAAELDAFDRVVDWHHRIWSTPHALRPGAGPGINLLASWDLAEPATASPPIDVPQPQGGADRNATPLYDFGRKRVAKHLLAQGPMRSSSMRTLGAHCNVFAAECFVDELAEMCGEDPVGFRLRHSSDPRAAAVITAAAALAGWTPGAPTGTGSGRGIGFARYKNSAAYFAVVAEVEIDQDVRLRRLYGAVDAGRVVHRDGLINQLEGGLIQAASWTLKEAAGWNSDGFTARSWRDYPTLKFSETPQILIDVIESGTNPALGVGECAAGPLAAAIGNAVHHAIGVRVRDMPLTRDRIERAIMADIPSA